MGWLERNLKQTITRWAAGSMDVYGNPTWTRTVIRGRWEDRQEKVVDGQGNELISNSIVFLNSDVEIGDYLYLGLDTSAVPPSGAREVKNFSKIPSIRFDQWERKAVLK